MNNLVTIIVAAIGVTLMAAPAFAGTTTPLPEPVSLSLLAGGVAAIAALKRFHRR